MIASPSLSKANSRRKSKSLAPPLPEHGGQSSSCCCHNRVWFYVKVIVVLNILAVIVMSSGFRELKNWLRTGTLSGAVPDSSEPPERADGTQSQQPAGTRTTDLDRGTQDLESLVLEQLPFGSIVKKTADRVRCHECRKKLPQRTMAETLEVFNQSLLDFVSQSGKATGPSPNLCAKCTQEATRLQLLVKSCSHTHVMSKNIVNGQPYQLYPAADCWLLINYAIDVLFATDYAQHNEVGNNEALVKVRVILESFLLNREMSHNTKTLLMLLDTIPADMLTMHKDPISGKLSLVNATEVQEV